MLFFFCACLEVLGVHTQLRTVLLVPAANSSFLLFVSTFLLSLLCLGILDKGQLMILVFATNDIET